MDVSFVILCDAGGAVGARDRLLGVPIVGWAINAVRRVAPVELITVVTRDPAIGAYVSGHGARAAEHRENLDGAVRVDPFKPFLAAASLRAALEAGANEVHAHAVSSMERLRITTRGDLELAEAVARGLAPTHPCVAGVRRMRLPLATAIDAVVSDVDGVLTDGRITIGSDGAHSRSFHMHDGLGTRRLLDAGMRVGWLSAGADDGTIRARAHRLGVEHVDVGEGEKGSRFERLRDAMGADAARTIFIGDDVNDLPAIELAAVSACPADARPEVMARVDLVLETPGGRGAFRELADVLLDRCEPGGARR